MNLWKCCNRNYAQSISKCRVCGKERPTYGIIEQSSRQDHGQKVNKPQKPSKQVNSRDPLISKDEEKLFVSTLKMKDGRTAEDINRER